VKNIIHSWRTTHHIRKLRHVSCHIKHYDEPVSNQLKCLENMGFQGPWRHGFRRIDIHQPRRSDNFLITLM
jgi:hypothetical protein